MQNVDLQLKRTNHPDRCNLTARHIQPVIVAYFIYETHIHS